LKAVSHLREASGIALHTLREHKMRSFLTLLGIILSVATLIVVIALVNGVNQYIADRVANLGTNVFQVSRFSISDLTSAQALVKATRRNKIINWEDFEYLRDNLHLASRVGVEADTSVRVSSGNTSLDQIAVAGVSANMGEMSQKEMSTGRYIVDNDNDHHSMVAVIGWDISEKLFPGLDALTRTIFVGGRPFTVVGVVKPIGTVLGQSQDAFVAVPIETFLAIYGNNNSLDISIEARGADWMDRTQEEARMLLRARRHLKPGDEDSFGIIAAGQLLDLFHSITDSLAHAMIGIVSVFLVIGGVVIMNVMLASVTERTREIGMRKSVGATRADILMQFLVESSVLAGMGGVIGLGLAWLLSYLVQAATSVPMAVPFSAVILAVGISTLVGLFFGIYPAHKASRLNPIEAMRQEI